jgi:hypothetical protein
MGSIYDSNFLDNYNAYKNKQSLTGGMVDPRVVGSLAQGDLEARYANVDKKKSLALQERGMNLNEQQLAQQTLNSNRNYDLSLQGLRNSERSAKDQKQQGMISGLMQLPMMGLTGYNIGKQMGLWGEPSKNELADLALKKAQTDAYNRWGMDSNNKYQGMNFYPSNDSTKFDYTSLGDAGNSFASDWDFSSGISSDIPWWENVGWMEL